MRDLIVSIALCGCAPDQAAKEELLALARAIEGASSYAFTINALTTGKSGGAPDPGADADPEPGGRGGARRDVWTVEFERGRPMHFTKGHAEFFRLARRYVALGRNDEWGRVELPPRTEGEAARADKLRGLARMAFEIDRLPLPHEFLAGLDARIAEVTRTGQDGKRRYVATLLPETVRRMMGGRAAKPGARGGGGEPGEPEPDDGQEAEDESEPEAGGEPPSAPPRSSGPPTDAPAWSGTLTVVAGDGGVERIELDLHSKTATGGRDVNRRIEIRGVNATTVNVPAPAAKKLEER